MQVPSVALAAIFAFASGSVAAEQLDGSAYPRLLKAYMVSKASPAVVEICSADDEAHSMDYAGAWLDWLARTPGVGFLVKATPEVDRVSEEVVAEFKAKTPEQRKSGCANFLRSFHEIAAVCGPPTEPVIRSMADLADLRTVLAGFTASEDHDVITRDNPATHYRTYAALFVDVDYAGGVEKVTFQRSTGNRKVDKALMAWVREMRFVPEDCEFNRTRRGVLPIDLRGGVTPGAWVPHLDSQLVPGRRSDAQVTFLVWHVGRSPSTEWPLSTRSRHNQMWKLGAQCMSANLGTILIWASWLYVVVAIFAAKRTYRAVRQSHPAYFGSPEKTRRDLLNLEEARGVFELITDSAIESKGFDASILKMVRTVRVLYFTAPIAFFIFVIGIAIS